MYHKYLQKGSKVTECSATAEQTVKQIREINNKSYILSHFS